MTTLAQRIGELNEQREWLGKRADFLKVIRAIALTNGPHHAAVLAQEERAPERVIEAVKAATDPISVSSVLSPFQLLAQSFLESLSASSAFDSMFGSMLRMPLRSRVVAATSTITGVSLAERDVKPVGQLSLQASDLDIAKAGAQIVVTKELLKSGGDGAARFLELELRRAVSIATDVQFLALITSGATSIPSSGITGTAMRLDLRALLQQITLGATSRPFLITTPDIAAAWATVGDSTGGVVFPNALWNGGTAAGVPIIATDGATSGEIILADASGIAANSEGLRVDRSEVTTVQMDTAPDSPPSASTSVVSLFQLDLAAVLVERFFGAKVVRPNAVAKITGASYSGNSP